MKNDVDIQSMNKNVDILGENQQKYESNMVIGIKFGV